VADGHLIMTALPTAQKPPAMARRVSRGVSVEHTVRVRQAMATTPNAGARP
jgi:hypothetical protein